MPIRFIALLALLVPASLLYAQTPSYLGSSGVLRTPSAEIAERGTFSYQFNTASDFPREFSRTNNHVINIGFADHFELGGRLTDWANERGERDNGTRPGIRDLSGNMKWRLPFGEAVVPDIALGVFDFAGEAIKLRSIYAVVTHEIVNTRFSVGLADGESDRSLDGFFANARVRISDNIDGLVDYANESFGFGVALSEEFSDIQLSATLSMDRTDSGGWNRAAGLTVTVPFERFGKFRRQPAALPSPLTRDFPSTEKLHTVLTELGFTSVRIGRTADSNVVSFENQVYNQNQLHALGAVLENTYRFLGNTDNLLVILTRSGQPLITLKTPTEAAGDFLNSKISSEEYAALISVAGAGETINTGDIRWNPDYSSTSRRFIDVRLQPDIRTVVGSEWGTFDYSLALRADARVPLPENFSLLASYSLPLAKSDLYSSGAFSNSAHEATINHAVVQRFGVVQNKVPWLASAGYQQISGNDYLLAKGEIGHTPQGLSGMIEARAAGYASLEDNLDDEFVATVGYRHRWHSRDLGVLAEAGQYFNEERGLKLELFRDFGDSTVTTFIRYIDSDDISGGLQMAVPLTPYKDRLANNTVVIRGSQRWRYQTGTTIKDPIFRGTNRIRPNMLREPELSHTLIKDFLDNGRLSRAYIFNHLQLLRQFR